jgi:hypothetical protein
MKQVMEFLKRKLRLNESRPRREEGQQKGDGDLSREDGVCLENMKANRSCTESHETPDTRK